MLRLSMSKGGFAAEGYAVKGNTRVALAISGSGGMNFVTSIGNCYHDSASNFLTGQIKSRASCQILQ